MGEEEQATLATLTGICISRPFYDQVKCKLKLEYECLGEQRVKYIAEPVRACKLRALSRHYIPPEHRARCTAII